MYNEKFMNRAIEIAENGRGKCSPNPFVGAVIVKNDTIIAEGFTQPCGFDHAEIQALKKCGEGSAGADLYVSLEPCAHYGKTPPCAEAIIKAGIVNVYAGIQDPNPKVNGKGFSMLKQAGINVEFGFFENHIKKQLEYYLTWVQTRKPFVMMKNAVSLDGRIAAENGNSKWITNDKSRQIVHELRNEVDAVLTTINTVVKDNPTLNVRLKDVYKHPLRVILDPLLEINLHSIVCQTAKEYQTVIFYDKNCSPSEKIEKLHSLSVTTIPVSAHKDKLNFDEILLALGSLNISSLLIESRSEERRVGKECS